MCVDPHQNCAGQVAFAAECTGGKWHDKWGMASGVCGVFAGIGVQRLYGVTFLIFFSKFTESKACPRHRLTRNLTGAAVPETALVVSDYLTGRYASVACLRAPAPPAPFIRAKRVDCDCGGRARYAAIPRKCPAWSGKRDGRLPSPRPTLML